MNLKLFNCLFVLITSVSISFLCGATEVISFVSAYQQSAHIRSLAASCAACHGSNGNSASLYMPSIAGLDAPYITKQLIAFKNGSRAGLVMQRHAKGLNVDEINLLAVYFSQQKPMIMRAPASQHLKTDNDY